VLVALSAFYFAFFDAWGIETTQDSVKKNDLSVIVEPMPNSRNLQYYLDQSEKRSEKKSCWESCKKTLKNAMVGGIIGAAFQALNPYHISYQGASHQCVKSGKFVETRKLCIEQTHSSEIKQDVILQAAVVGALVGVGLAFYTQYRAATGMEKLT
jgi:hypothetical protein